MTQTHSEIQTADIDHLGIIAGIIDEIGLVEKINELLGTHPQEEVSAGNVVKAMLLNCMGFITAPLYLFSQFFEGKATEHLLGEGVKPEHLNDDRLGRVLDKLHQKGLSQVFMEVALSAAKRFEISSKSMHLDGTSFHVHGQYLEVETSTDTVRNEPVTEAIQNSDSPSEPKPIKITYGYSRDRRPDLKQFIVNIFSSNDGDIPLGMVVGDGNESEKTKFPELIKNFKEQWTFSEIQVFIADSSLYSKDNLVSLGQLPWITRVPMTVKEAVSLVSSLAPEDFVNSSISGYRIATRESEYGGVKQRWLIVESEERRCFDIQQLSKRLTQQKVQQEKLLQKLSKEEFNCTEDAQKVVDKFAKKLKYYQLQKIQIFQKESYKKSGRPRKQASPDKITYQVRANLVENEATIAAAFCQAGRFILATNLMDTNQWNADDILREYKEQQCAERGFRFLKDPLFFASSVFVKSSRRVAALAMVMGLCLLVYTLGQRQIRKALAEEEETVKNQVGKPTNKPTLRWIFQCFQSIHLVWVNGQKMISNLTEDKKWMLKFLLKTCQSYYLIL